MFKAVDSRKDEEIIILDPEWADRVDLLRSLDRQDVLVCQGCRQPVRVRAGVLRRWHFAHKHRQNCSYGRESARILKARVVLYRWLVGKFGDKVSLEKQLGSDRFPRPADCWVEGKLGSLAYWVIESRMRRKVREDLNKGFEQLGVMVNWVFVADMLREDQNTPNRVHLTTTEREFMQRSDYDEAVQDGWFAAGGSLHYLDPDDEILTTYRGLYPVHPPQLFEGHKESHEIAAVLVSPKTGEFVHPGEHESLKEYEQRKLEREEARKRVPLGLQSRFRRSSVESTPRQNFNRTPQRRVDRHRSAKDLDRVSILAPSQQQDSAESPHASGQEEAVCVFCGRKTRDWWYFDGTTKTCKCNDCLQKD